MRTAGIICEYNPFHNGHFHHTEKTREAGADAIIAVMSGSFVQRGEPAVMPARERTRAALACGADLVISLPVQYAVASAGRFARGGVRLLEACGCVDMLSFGSECADTSLVSRCAQALADERADSVIKSLMNEGVSYPSARREAVLRLCDEKTASVLDNPNDLLAVEYACAISEINSGIVPFAVRREGTGHNSADTSDCLASASLLRKLIYSGGDISPYVPDKSHNIFNGAVASGRAPAVLERYELAVLSQLRRMSPEDFLSLEDVGEGLENVLYNAVRVSTSLEQVLDEAKSKRYTHSRLRRILTCAFLGITKGSADEEPAYIRVLGFTEKGRELLRVMDSTARLPVVSSYSQLRLLGDSAKRQFTLECAATDRYALLMPTVGVCGADMTDFIITV